MRKELIETEAIEKYLLHRLNEEERKQFEINRLLDPALTDKTEAQAGVYKLIRLFWRKQTRKRLELIYQQLLQESSFVQQLR
jgi:hypothetical protein